VMNCIDAWLVGFPVTRVSVHVSGVLARAGVVGVL
jgi:hypothetical protein